MNADARILSALRGAVDGVSGADLCAQAGLAETALQGRIAELRRLGYEIEASPHTGYRLRSVPDLLHGDDLRSRVGSTRVVAREIHVFQETTSTNDVAEKLARDGVREGVVVFAEAQSRGRGRLGRAWLSPARRGLWFSVLLRPRIGPPAVTQITVTAGAAIARALQASTGVAVEIKWPNDLLVRGRKVGGILTELSAELDRVKHVVLGIGIDVNQEERDFPEELRTTATSLRLATGQIQDRAQVAAQVLRELDADYARQQAGEFEAIADEWEARCSTIGREVVIAVGDRQVRGRAESLDADGALLVRTDHGHLERVTGGDVTVESGEG